MKKTTILSMAALLLGSSALFAQSAHTKPAGFVKHTLKKGFNLIGLTLHEAVSVTGTFTAVVANNNGTTGDAKDDYSVLTDTSVNFQTALTANKTYILEITSGALAGTIQEVKTWNVGNNVNTIKAENDIVSGTGVKVGDKFQMRAAMTISDIFGANNSAGLKATANYSINEADIVYIPNGNGGFSRYFYSNAAGDTKWYNSKFEPSSEIAISYADSILILRKDDADLELVLTGSVKTSSTSLALESANFNYIGSIYPVGTTLKNSGLQNNIAATANYSMNEADVIYMPDGQGGYNRYFYSNAANDLRWYNSKFEDSDNVAIQSGIIIFRRGAAQNVKITPPASYNTL